MELQAQAQSAVEQSRTWHDLNSLSKLRSQGDSKEAITEAAKQFESVFFAMMMKSMRDASKAIIDKPFFDSPSLDLFQDMYDKQISLDMSDQTGSRLGLADILVEQLTRGRDFEGASTEDPSNDKSAAAVENGSFRRTTAAQPVLSSLSPTANSKETDNTAATKVSDETSLNEPELHIGTFNGPESLVAVAPTEMKGIDFSSPAAFVSSLLPIAKQYAQKLKVDPKVLLAQAALETGWGKHVMRTIDGISSNNLFGIKADRSWQGDSTSVNTLEFEDGQLLQTKAAFRSYNSHEESFKDYVEFLNNSSRYQKALTASENAKDYLSELQSAGYATDPNYADKIYQIYRSDTLNDAVNSAPFTGMR
ncbi:MAG: flagellar assembly peptidoglycan hydrolase FlgJ [Gammaproteobacteria bacterium]